MLKTKFAIGRSYAQTDSMLVRYSSEITMREAAAWALEQPSLSQLWAYRSTEDGEPFCLFLTWQCEKHELPRVPVGKLRCKPDAIQTGVATRTYREDNAHEWQEIIVVRPSLVWPLRSRISVLAQEMSARETTDILVAQRRAPIDQLLDPTAHNRQLGGAITWGALLWAGFTEPQELFVASDLRAAAITIHRGGDSSLQSWPDYLEHRRLKALLGEGFISGTQPDIHQSLITVKLIDLITPDKISVELRSWDSLSDELQRLQSFQYESLAPPRWFSHPKNTILFLQPTAIEAVDRRQLTNMYKAIRLLQPGYGAQLRVYPNEIEMEKEHNKLGDIKALDHIANSAVAWKYQYRPRTCFRPERCVLAEFEKSVHKRVNSDCAKHVEVRHRTQRDGLRCELSNHKKVQNDTPETAGQSQRPSPSCSHSKIAENVEQWFHQEYVESLSKEEYRVFIVTEPGDDSLRGRSPRILKVIKTTSASLRETSNKNSLAEEQTLYNCREYTELNNFALYIFERLRGLPGAELEFESLDVAGVRLDIAKSDIDAHNSRSRFFVNEITRWHSAYYFSRWACPSPHTQICEAFATAFCSYFFPQDKATATGGSWRKSR